MIPFHIYPVELEWNRPLIVSHLREISRELVGGASPAKLFGALSVVDAD